MNHFKTLLVEKFYLMLSHLQQFVISAVIQKSSHGSNKSEAACKRASRSLSKSGLTWDVFGAIKRLSSEVIDTNRV